MTHDTLTLDQLLTPEGKALYRHFSAKLLDMEHRIARATRFAAKSYLAPHEQNRVNELMGAP